MNNMPPQHYQQESLFGQARPVLPSPLLSNWQKADETARKARARCAEGHHTLQPTLTKGERLCTVCYIKVCCPDCMHLSDIPSRAHVAHCAEHRREP